MATLYELLGRADVTLYDAETGLPMVDADGRADDPRDFEVLAVHRAGGYAFAAVLGPSGEPAVHGPEAGAIHAGALLDADELPAWVAENYPS